METLANGINKPRLIVGNDKRFFAYFFLLSCGVYKVCDLCLPPWLPFWLSLLLSLLLSGAAFAAACYGGAELISADAQYLDILPSLWRQCPVYDIGRRDTSRVVIEIK